MKIKKLKFIVSLVIFVLIGLYLLSLLFFKDFIISGFDGILPFFTWFFGLTLGPMIPGILYTGGKGYSKIFGSNLFKTKEKGFLFFFLDLIFGTVIIVVSLFVINKLIIFVVEYVFLIFIFWVLLFYLWFNRYKKYKFPHYYFWTTLIILIGGGVLIYFYL